MFHNRFDSHTHTDNSHDAMHSVMYMAEYAEKQGLMGVAVTDHAEIAKWEREQYHTRVVQSIVDANKAKVAFRHRMSITIGLELGLTRNMELADKVIEMYPFDFVLGSLHQDREGRDYYRIPYASMERGEIELLAERYFEDMLHIVQWGRFDALAHMTFLHRYAHRRGVELDIGVHFEQVDTILREMVQRGIALELNAAGLRSGYGVMPPRRVLERYRELGGELVTMGSDAHRAEDIGGGIEDCMQLLESVGMRYFSFFSKRKPVMLRIV